MPHVKGNKFKPTKLQGDEEPQRKRRHANGSEPPAAASAEAAAPTEAEQHPRQKKKKVKTPAHADKSSPAVAVETVVGAVPAPSGSTKAESNWDRLQAALRSAGPPKSRGRHRDVHLTVGAAAAAVAGPQALLAPGADVQHTHMVAIDCEMVGVGPGGKESALARVCVVNAAGGVLLDTHVKPRERVTDFRTAVSGIRPSDLVGAVAFEEAQSRVAELLRGRMLVGHALENDLRCLYLAHPKRNVRDTARYPPLMRQQIATGRLKPRPLRQLAEEQLGLSIQDGQHCPVADARAALYIYLRHKKVGTGPGCKSAHPAQRSAADSTAPASVLQQWEQSLTKQGKLRAKSKVAPAAKAGQPQTAAALAKADYMADL